MCATDKDDAPFEPGQDCPLDADGRMRWSQAKADERFAVARENAQQYADFKRWEE